MTTKKFFFLLVLLLALNTGFSQPGDARKKHGFRKENMLNNDSVAVRLQRLQDSIKKTLQEVNVQKDFSRDINQLIEIQKKQKAKEKKTATIRIGIGIALLAVLLVGLFRKRAKK